MGEDMHAMWTGQGTSVNLPERAAVLAAAAHQGQTDKVGEPYIEHPARVAQAVLDATGDEYATAVAWLHDVVEDTDVTLEDLYDLGYPPEILDAVNAISKRKGEKFTDYYERVKANDLALVVKWHDVADNSNPARLARVAPDTRDRLRAKYERARAILSEASVVEILPCGCVPPCEGHRDE